MERRPNWWGNIWPFLILLPYLLAGLLGGFANNARIAAENAVPHVPTTRRPE
jgi:hypothetical protein